MLLGKEPFIRICETSKEKDYQNFLIKIKPIYHLNNFTNFYVRNLYEILSFYDLEFLEIYIFELLRAWVYKNQKYNYTYVRKYKNLVKFLEIEPRFSFLEHAYFEKINQIIFALNRKLKSLNPEFINSKKENNYYFSENLILEICLNSNKSKSYIGALIITNKRMIFLLNKNNFFQFWLKDIIFKKVNFSNVYFKFKDCDFKIQTITPEVLNIYIDKIIWKENRYKNE